MGQKAPQASFATHTVGARALAKGTTRWVATRAALPGAMTSSVLYPSRAPTGEPVVAGFWKGPCRAETATRTWADAPCTPRGARGSHAVAAAALGPTARRRRAAIFFFPPSPPLHSMAMPILREFLCQLLPSVSKVRRVPVISSPHTHVRTHKTVQKTRVSSSFFEFKFAHEEFPAPRHRS